MENLNMFFMCTSPQQRIALDSLYVYVMNKNTTCRLRDAKARISRAYILSLFGPYIRLTDVELSAGCAVT